MKNSMRYEWCRLTTTRGLYLLSVSVVLGALVVSWAMTMMIADLAPDMSALARTEAATVAATRTPFLLLAAGLLGAFSFGQEKRYGTLTHAFLAIPDRKTLSWAKTVVTLLITTAWALISVPAAVVVSNVLLNSGYVFQSEPRIILGLIALANLWALAGIAAGILLSRTGAIVFLVACSTLIEPLLSQLLSKIEVWGTSGASYLPFTAGSALISLGNSDFSEAIAESGQRLPALAGAAIFLTYISIALLAAFRRILKSVN